MSGGGRRIPWWAKIAAKMVLARLPFGYGLWQRLGLFRHGRMDQSDYVRKVFEQHVERAGFSSGMAGRTVLELGPGDSVATALVAAAYGARAILIDAGDYAVGDVEFYRRFASALKEAGLQPPDLATAVSRDDVVALCGARYLAEGLTSLREVESDSVDLIFSQAVLEHVRRHEFAETMRECHRVLKDGGVASHRVDLKDHLGGSLNNLRFSEKWWESDLFVRSGFYTNRIRCAEMLEFFKASGFAVDVLAVDRWDTLPIKRQQLDQQFASLPDEDLRVKGFDVLLRPVASQ